MARDEVTIGPDVPDGDDNDDLDTEMEEVQVEVSSGDIQTLQVGFVLDIRTQTLDSLQSRYRLKFSNHLD